MNPWQPEDLSLVFLTCPRDPPYFAATLASALLGDPLTIRLGSVAVAVDSADLACVESLSNHRRVRWVPRSDVENARASSFHLHRRACHNYWRALGLGDPEARAVFVCEDDLTFRDGWLGMLLQSLSEIEANGLEKFLLAAYSPRQHEEPALRRGQFYGSYIAHGFYGTQAMVYPRLEVPPVRDLLWEHGVEVSEAPYDLLIQRRAVAEQHLYTTRQSLVQHVGLRSTGLGGGHTSPTFLRPWPSDESSA